MITPEIIKRIKELAPLHIAPYNLGDEGELLKLICQLKESVSKIVVWKDGTYKIIEDGITHEFENDDNWLTTIAMTEYAHSFSLQHAGDGWDACQKFFGVDGADGTLIHAKENYLASLPVDRGSDEWISVEDFKLTPHTWYLTFIPAQGARTNYFQRTAWFGDTPTHVWNQPLPSPPVNK